MANSGLAVSSSSSSSLLALVSLLLFMVAPLHVASQDLASTVCPKTRNPAFCSNVVNSAHTTDLKTLASFTLNLAHNNAVGNLNLARSLAAKATNPQLKTRYSSCGGSFDDAVDDVEEAQKSFASNDFFGANVQASAAMTNADDCLENFKQPPADASPLSKNAQTLKDICSIILVVTNLLRGQRI